MVLEKLGHGSSSSVWLVWDSIQHQYVALKLLLHKSVESRKWAKEEEIQILKHIVKEDALNCENVVKMYDHFEHEKHQCMVFEHLGVNLRTLLTQNSSSQDYPTAAAGLPLQIVKHLAREILSGLDFLHHQLSVVHNDLKPENILLMIPSARNSKLPLDDDACLLPAKFSPEIASENDCLLPAKSSYSRGQKSLSISSSSATVIACCNDPKSVQAAFGCKIADLGSACYVKSLPSKRIVQTWPYRCPEILLGAALSPAADIWSFGCMVFELATGCILFGSTGAGRTCHHKDLHHLACMWEILGPIPHKVSSTGKYARHYFKSDGKLHHFEKASLNQVGTGHLEELLQKQHGLPGKEAHALARFLCPLLDFVPMKRPSTSQCLVHPWLSL
jgi:serine/threonine-protein kinase SRPK3